MRRFEIITDYKDKNINLPVRATKKSAGYDLQAAEDVIVPSIFNTMKRLTGTEPTWDPSIIKKVPYFLGWPDDRTYTLKEIKDLVKEYKFVTMIPTGLKVNLSNNEYLSIHDRSSIGINCLLMLPHQTGIIDADYYNNEDNEGHIFIPMVNFSPYDIKIEKGERIAQGIIGEYKTVDDEEDIDTVRKGGYGSTDGIAELTPIELEPADKAIIEDGLSYVYSGEYPEPTLKGTDINIDDHNSAKAYIDINMMPKLNIDSGCEVEFVPCNDSATSISSKDYENGSITIATNNK